MEVEVSYLFVNNNVNLMTVASNHIAWEVSCARMGPQTARRSTGALPTRAM